MGRLTGSGSSIWLVASPLINSALASGLRPSARTATPAGSTQLSSRVGRWPPLNSNGGQRLGSSAHLVGRLAADQLSTRLRASPFSSNGHACGINSALVSRRPLAAAQLERRAASRLLSSFGWSPRRSRRLRLLGSVSAPQLIWLVASPLSSPAAPRQRLGSSAHLVGRLAALVACGSSAASRLLSSFGWSPRRSRRLRLLGSVSAPQLIWLVASPLSSPAAPRQRLGSSAHLVGRLAALVACGSSAASRLLSSF